MNSYISQKREKRIQARQRTHCSFKIWSEYDNESNQDHRNSKNSDEFSEQTVEDIYNSFLEVRNILNAEKVNKKIAYDYYEYLESESSSSSDEELEIEEKIQNEMNTDLISVQNEFLNKKTIRAEDENNIENNISIEESSLDQNKPVGGNIDSILDIEPLLNLEMASVGPEPMKVEFSKNMEWRYYMRAGLKREEAEMIAQYVKEGKRIPRRGEVGMTSQDIEKFESLGYVMSGMRNSRMNKMRVKKEQMLYTVEEKKALAIYNLEEKQRRERNIINEMKIMWKNKLDGDYEDEDENVVKAEGSGNLGKQNGVNNGDVGEVKGGDDQVGINKNIGNDDSNNQRRDQVEMEVDNK